MNNIDTHKMVKIRVRLQYKSYFGYFYYITSNTSPVTAFTLIRHKMFCLDCICSSDCDLEIDYDVEEFSCILRDESGNKYELIDDFCNLNFYIVKSEKVLDERSTPIENGIEYYDYKEKDNTLIKITLKFLSYEKECFIYVKNKGIAAFSEAFVLLSDCFKKEKAGYSCKLILKDNHIMTLQRNDLNNMYDYISKIEIIDVIQ